MSQKNILLIFADQQRHDTIEALGNPIIKTPALNSLVQNGTAFTRAYSPCPVCIPARYSMHTGQMPHRVNCVVNERTPSERKSFMELLRDNGYQTHGVGKMHFNMRDLPSDTLWGFESRDFSEEGGGDDDFKKFLVENGYDYVYDPHGVRGDMAINVKFKYIYSAADQKEWLFDLKTDPEETRNKAYNPMYISQKEIMKKSLIEYLKKDGYTLPFKGDDWKKGPIKTLSDDPDAYLLFQDPPESIPDIPGYKSGIIKIKPRFEGPYRVGF